MRKQLISWPLPKIDDIIVETGGSTVFSTIDLLKGFWQQPLREDTKKFSAFVTPMGSYEYNVNPFGWKNSPKYFQKMMDEVLMQHKKYCRWYIDDILIFSRDRTRHTQHLNAVLKSLAKVALKINPKKCKFYQSRVKFLGRMIDGSTRTTTEESVSKVRDLKVPKNLKALQKFLGLCGYFRSFIKNYATICKPLSGLTNKDNPYEWGESQQTAFELLKKIITENPVLSLPDFSRTFVLTTDASDVGTGAVLSQIAEDGKERAVGYYSYTLNRAESNYSTTDKEMLTVIKAVEYFRTFLDEQKFMLRTDHSAAQVKGT